MQFLIISGLSGAGKSKAASFLEDLGFYCVDNMPVDFLPQFAALCLATKGRYEKVALVTDVRSGLVFDKLFRALEEVGRIIPGYKIIFVEAGDEALVARYKETRRRHPLTIDGTDLVKAVARERELLAPVRARANYVIDTTALSTAKLRGELISMFAENQFEKAMVVNVISFGFKYGIPIDADLVMDVRFLPNPFYIDELRELTGLDEGVRSFVFSYQHTLDFMKHLDTMLNFLLPLYTEEGKTSLVIAIGCTGGKHRSVAISKALKESIEQKGYTAVVNHRDISRA